MIVAWIEDLCFSSGSNVTLEGGVAETFFNTNPWLGWCCVNTNCRDIWQAHDRILGTGDASLLILFSIEFPVVSRLHSLKRDIPGSSPFVIVHFVCS